MWRVIARGMKYFLCLSLLKWSWTTLCLHLWLLCTVGGETFETKNTISPKQCGRENNGSQIVTYATHPAAQLIDFSMKCCETGHFSSSKQFKSEVSEFVCPGVFHQGEFLGTHHCNPDKASLPLSHMLAANYSGHTALRTVWEKLHLMSYLWQMVSF